MPIKHPRRVQTQHIVLHCSATRANQPFEAKEIRAMHLRRGFNDIGYHYVITRDGRVQSGRPADTIGAHVAGWNDRTLGVCLIGGLNNATGQPEDNFTPAQWTALRTLMTQLLKKYAFATVLGHRDLSPDRDRDGKVEPHEWLKVCPCFDARAWARGNGLRAAA